MKMTVKEDENEEEKEGKTCIPNAARFFHTSVLVWRMVLDFMNLMCT